MSKHHLKRSRWLALLAVLALFATALFPSGAAADDDDDDDDDDVECVLTILHNNDGESELLPFGDDDELGGVARFATKVRQEKRNALRGDRGKHRDDDDDDDDRARRGVVLVSSGDNFLASPSFTASTNDGFFYDARAVDYLRYDAIAIGNHEFDFGPDILEEFIRDFRRLGRPPYLSANLDFTGEPGLQQLVRRGGIAKSTVVRECGERIGIIGATTENLPFISSPRNVEVDPVLPAVQAEIDRLERRGVERIILISHLQDVDGDVALAAQLSGIDVMIAGGGDELLANADDLLLPSDDPSDIFGPYPIVATNADGDSVPVVTTSGQYGYLGKLVVEFDEDGDVVDFDGGPLRIVDESVGSDGVRDNRRMLRRVVAPVQEFVDGLASNIIAQSEVDLDGRRSPGVRTMETNEGNLIADSQLWQASQLAGDFGLSAPDVALQNGGGIRNDSIIPAGPISELDTFDMVPFGNFVSLFPALTRQTFKEVLENAVSRTQSGDIPGGTGRFAQVAGFSFVYSASGTAQVIDGDGNITTPGTRVREVVLDDGTVIVTGGSVVAGPDISLAIADFNARGGDQYPFAPAPFTVLGVSYQQALSNYIQAPIADGGLGGQITAAQYPEGGEDRITEIS